GPVGGTTSRASARWAGPCGAPPTRCMCGRSRGRSAPARRDAGGRVVNDFQSGVERLASDTRRLGGLLALEKDRRGVAGDAVYAACLALAFLRAPAGPA